MCAMPARLPRLPIPCAAAPRPAKPCPAALCPAAPRRAPCSPDEYYDEEEDAAPAAPAAFDDTTLKSLEEQLKALEASLEAGGGGDLDAARAQHAAGEAALSEAGVDAAEDRDALTLTLTLTRTLTLTLTRTLTRTRTPTLTRTRTQP